MIKKIMQIWIPILAIIFLPIGILISQNNSKMGNDMLTMQNKLYTKASQDEDNYEMLEEYDLKESNVYHRLYLDSSGDTLKSKDNNIDYNLGNQSKNKWYYVNLDIANFYYEDYGVSSKQGLINQIGDTFKIEYYYSFNFWDSKIKWKYPNGKESAYKKSSDSIKITTSNNQKTIESDKGKKDKEKGEIKLATTWSNEGLKITVKLGVWYTWAWGSIYHHASLTKFQLASLSTGNSILVTDSLTIPVFQKVQMSGTRYLYLDNLFSGTRAIYLASIANGWKNLNLLTASYNVAGPITCSNAIGYGYINIFHFKSFFDDIKSVLKTGKLGSGSFKLVYKDAGLYKIYELYYVSIANKTTKIATATMRNAKNCSIAYSGITFITYSYKK